MDAGQVGEDAAAAIDEVASGGVYTLRDVADNVVRTGRTNDFIRRAGELGRNPETTDLRFNPEDATEDPATQRGLEQMLYDEYPGAALNKIRPIAVSNSTFWDYISAAQGHLSG